MMSDDDKDGQMIFGDLGGLKLPDICLTGEEKPRKNLTQEACPDRGSNPGPLRDRRIRSHKSLNYYHYIPTEEGDLPLILNLLYLQHDNGTFPDRDSYSKSYLLSPLYKP